MQKHQKDSIYYKCCLLIPTGWELYENQMGETMVTSPWGWNYEINEVLEGNEKPCFYAKDKSGKGHRTYLKIAE